MYTVFPGGVGASRFLQGLAQVVPQRDITVISNTGNDVEMFAYLLAYQKGLKGITIFRSGTAKKGTLVRFSESD